VQIFALERKMKKTSSASKTAFKNKGLLVSVARTIGSTLGTVAGTAERFPVAARRRRATKKADSKKKIGKTRKRNKT
jgi:hypothetical protein